MSCRSSGARSQEKIVACKTSPTGLWWNKAVVLKPKEPENWNAHTHIHTQNLGLRGKGRAVSLIWQAMNTPRLLFTGEMWNINIEEEMREEWMKDLSAKLEDNKTFLEQHQLSQDQPNLQPPCSHRKTSGQPLISLWEQQRASLVWKAGLFCFSSLDKLNISVQVNIYLKRII